MARIMALDFGKKRTGIAVSDPEQIIARGLETVPTDELIGYMKRYFKEEPVELVIIGYPLNMDNTPTDATPLVEKFIGKYTHVFPDVQIVKVDERLSSKMASTAISGMGLKKKVREEKGLIDTVAATILLQDYLGGRR
jgi:putative Holliday junction resolvase